tara:strand:+ start:2151 stop:2423 length:273 start_codon:yes stop_codon:yes gene_type:complete
MDKRKTNGGKREGAGRKSKSEEYGLHEEMDDLKPTKDVLVSFVNIIENTDDEKLKFSAIVKWLEWRVGKPKETRDIKMDVNKNFPDWLDE